VRSSLVSSPGDGRCAAARAAPPSPHGPTVSVRHAACTISHSSKDARSLTRLRRARAGPRCWHLLGSRAGSRGAGVRGGAPAAPPHPPFPSLRSVFPRCPRPRSPVPLPLPPLSRPARPGNPLLSPPSLPRPAPSLPAFQLGPARKLPPQSPLPHAPPPSGWNHRHPIARPRLQTASQPAPAAASPVGRPAGEGGSPATPFPAPLRLAWHLAAGPAPAMSRAPTRPASAVCNQSIRTTFPSTPTRRHPTEHPPSRARRAEHQLVRAADPHLAAPPGRRGGRQEDSRDAERRLARPPLSEAHGPSQSGTVTRGRHRPGHLRHQLP
jgi:hypothetical protein